VKGQLRQRPPNRSSICAAEMRVPVYEVIIQSEFQNERSECLQNLSWLVFGLVVVLWQTRVHGKDLGAIHYELVM
jgi:hypothetical protein